MPPPPIPTASSLSSLTEDQLRLLESDERAGLEARIQWLRDIGTLLDSAVEQMKQYSMVNSIKNTYHYVTLWMRNPTHKRFAALTYLLVNSDMIPSMDSFVNFYL